MSAVKVTCPVCGRPNRMLTKTGKISPHNNPSKGRAGLPFGVRCKGSGRRPEDVVGGTR